MQMNELDTRQQLMVITMEECAELSTVCSKILRTADVEQRRTQLVEELGDVYCMIQLMQEHDVVSWQELEDRAEVKREKLTHWSDLI